MAKRKRDPHGVDRKLVEVYEDLASEDNDIRVQAAKVLCLEYSTQDAVTSGKAKEIVRRLVRGSCSGRKAARLGFSMALTEYLSQIFERNTEDGQGQLNIDDLIDLIESQTKVVGSVSGQEQRDHCFGRLFAAKAVIESCVLKLSNFVTEIQWSRVLRIVVGLARDKLWLREECGFLLYRILPLLCSQRKEFAQTLLDKVLEPETGLLETSEGVAIWLEAQDQSCGLKLPKKIWHHQAVLSRKESAHLIRIIVKSSKESEGAHPPGPKAMWRPHVHFVWDAILSRLLNPLDETKHKLLTFKQFWKAAVDETLFAASSSPERKYLGFVVFQFALGRTHQRLINVLFSRNLMKCFINQLSSENRFLHQMAIKTSSSITEHVSKHPNHALEILTALLMPPFGLVNLDQVAKKKTRIIHSILQQVPEDNLEALLDIYQILILRPDEHDEKASDLRRQSAFDQVSSLIKSFQEIDTISHDKSSAKVSFVKKALEMFVCLGYFNYAGCEDTVKPPLSNRSRQEARTRILSCLSHLMNTTSNPSFFPIVVVEKIQHGEKSTPGWDCIIERNASIVAAHTTLKILKDNSEMEPFKLLYSLTLLEVYNGDSDAMSMLDELEQCYNDLNKPPGEDYRYAERQNASEALIEIILSFIAKPSQLFRRMAQQVFAASASSMTESGMQSMLKILDTKETLNGQAEIFDAREAEVFGSVVSGDDEVEMLDGSAEGDGAGSEEVFETLHNSSDENREDNGDSDGDDAELQAFDAKLAQALGTRPLTVSSTSQAHEPHDPSGKASSDSSGSSDSDMTDSQMQALDEHLSAVFRERKAAMSATKSRKAEKRDAKETIVNFKTRVLELVEIYVKQQPASPIAFGVLVPLLRSIRTTQSPQVSRRACEVIKQFSKASKGNKRSNEFIPPIHSLESVHAEAMSGGSNAFGAACSQASLIIVRAMKEQMANVDGIVDVYADSWKRKWHEPNCKISPVLFADFNQWIMSN